MVILGQTSRGNPIWLDWRQNELGKIEYSFAEFENLQENFESLCVVELMRLRKWQKAESPQDEINYRTAWRNYRTKCLQNPREYRSHLEKLGIRTSINRINYGRKFVRPEFDS